MLTRTDFKFALFVNGQATYNILESQDQDMNLPFRECMSERSEHLWAKVFFDVAQIMQLS